jgi:transposase
MSVFRVRCSCKEYAWIPGSRIQVRVLDQEYRDTIEETERRVERLTNQLRQLTPAWRWAPAVDALQALRSVSFITAVGLVTEVGDSRRFAHPRELMA